MAVVDREEWDKLQVITLNGWNVSVSGSQHVLGWLILQPPEKVEGSIVHLSDKELLNFKKVGALCEVVLNELFSPDLFNYSVTGNVIKDLHVHLQPRYSSPREFANYRFIDENWGRAVRFLPYERLPQKEIVFDLVDTLKKAFNKNLPEDLKATK